jgi:hypothetical protein
MRTKANKTATIVSTTLALSVLLAGCQVTGSGGEDPKGELPGPQKAVVATVAPDYSAGAHAVFSTEAPFSGSTQLAPTISDITVTCSGEYFYRIERFQGENVSRFHIGKPDTPIYQYSTKDASGVETASSNPYGLVFISPTKAYLLRYGSSALWIVNPAARTEAEFKLGEIDLSAYSVDGAPNMAAGIVVDGKAYIALQRLDKSYAPQDAYVVVIDTATDAEIDTGKGRDGLKGFLLPVKNPADIEYSAADGLIYVQGIGRYGSSYTGRAPEYTGGIVSIDPQAGLVRQVVDDGDATDHPLGLITGMEITSATRGYLIGYKGFNDNALYSFNPATGKIDRDAEGKPKVVAGISGLGIGGLAADKAGQLWVSVADAADPGLTIISAADGSVVKDHVPTVLNPQTITFCDSPQ